MDDLGELADASIQAVGFIKGSVISVSLDARFSFWWVWQGPIPWARAFHQGLRHLGEPRPWV